MLTLNGRRRTKRNGRLLALLGGLRGSSCIIGGRIGGGGSCSGCGGMLGDLTHKGSGIEDFSNGLGVALICYPVGSVRIRGECEEIKPLGCAQPIHDGSVVINVREPIVERLHLTVGVADVENAALVDDIG